MIRIGSVIWLVGVLAACSGNATSSAKGEAASTDVGATTAETSPTAGTDDTAENSANSTGASPGADTGGTGENTANSTEGSNPVTECDGSCPPCDEGQRRSACTPLCICEAIDDVARDEQERLLSCDWEQPCNSSLLRDTANAGSPIYGFVGLECLFSAFRDRTQGRFTFTHEQYAGFWIEHSQYVFVLDGSDTMLVLRSRFAGGPGANAGLGYSVESCTLADPSTFDPCTADPESCVQVSDWFGNCVETSDVLCPVE